MKIIIFIFFPSMIFGQNIFPLMKWKDIDFDSINVSEVIIDSKGDTIVTYDSIAMFSRKTDKFLFLNPSIKLAFLYLSKIPYFGNASFANFGDERVIINGNSIGFTNQGVDTLLIKGALYFEINPFPNVFVVNEKVFTDSLKKFYSMKYHGEPHYTFHHNQTLSSACIINNEYGSVKFYWDEKGRKIKEGAFWLNKKNGPWKYFNKRGKLKGTEYYEKGVLIKSEGKTPKKKVT